MLASDSTTGESSSSTYLFGAHTYSNNRPCTPQRNSRHDIFHTEGTPKTPFWISKLEPDQRADFEGYLNINTLYYPKRTVEVNTESFKF